MQKMGYDDRKKVIGEISPDTVIWRYMNLYQLVDIIENNRLFFCRADKFEDPFEGKRSLPSKEFLRELYHQMKLKDENLEV